MQRRYTSRRRVFQKKNIPSPKTSLEIINAIRANKNQTEVGNTDIYTPRHRFNDFVIAEGLKRNIVNKGYLELTPIQDQVIPAILEGKDVVGIANTGTGKTAAFLVPLINKVLRNRYEKVFILTPTRELAIQINEELNSFIRGMRMNTALCFGGANIHRQENQLRNNPNFVIGTPGRVKDLIEHRVLFLSQFRTVVLDETDRMVDIGFINDIKYFINLLPKERQSLFFSATVSRKIQEIIQSFSRNPVIISVKKQDTAQNVKQEMIKTNSQGKIEQLHDLLIQKEFEKVLIFGRTKHGVQKLSDELFKRGFKAEAIHGNKRQSQRQKVLQQFKNNQINILLATDVASRGLDIRNISHVINYDLPETYEDYIHRIGRTGRADKKGVALTFIEGYQD